MAIEFKLRELLASRDLKELQFAKKYKIREGTFYDICNNQIQRIPVHTIDVICTALNVEPGEWIVRKFER